MVNVYKLPHKDTNNTHILCSTKNGTAQNVFYAYVCKLPVRPWRAKTRRSNRRRRSARARSDSPGFGFRVSGFGFRAQGLGSATVSCSLPQYV